ncbi:hypothetical protein MUK42_14142 [Musa troglodytarum]|uniref:Uncharacterized protein n=1 Tax=Musa troglodytarum TaxID=320322 RepID=A0A9E7L995_9LILI|nr:hypothetical protein MUK42_14142 [Musa troglodytarum]
MIQTRASSWSLLNPMSLYASTCSAPPEEAAAPPAAVCHERIK